MKRLFLFLSFIALFFVSCDTEKRDVGILSLKIDTLSSRALEMAGSSSNPDEIIWVFRLKKEDEGFSFGETKEKIRMNGTSASVSIAFGNWSIEVEGFKDSEFNELVYRGQKTFTIGKEGLDLVVEVGVISDVTSVEGKNTANLILQPITINFNLGSFEGVARELNAIWSVNDEMIESWILNGGDSNWRRENNDIIPSEGVVKEIPPGEETLVILTVVDGLGNIVAKEGWQIECNLNCTYVIGGAMTKRGALIELEVEVAENLPTSENCEAPVIITSYTDIDINQWEPFKDAKGFIVGFELGSPQEEIVYVQNLDRAADFPIIAKGVYNYPVYYGNLVDINALIVETPEKLNESGADWAIILGNVGMKENSPVNKNLRKIIVNKSMKEIIPYMFRNCTALTSVVFEDFTGDSIGEYAFENCSSLYYAPYNENVVRIGEGAFKGCSRLEVARITKNVKSIGAEAFKGCTCLYSMIVEDKREDGAWYVGEDRIFVSQKEFKSSAEELLTETYVDEFWVWGDIPDSWKWVEVTSGPSSVQYELDPENSCITVYETGVENRVLYSGDECRVNNWKIVVKVELGEDGIWYVYHDGEVHCYFKYIPAE